MQLYRWNGQQAFPEKMLRVEQSASQLLYGVIKGATAGYGSNLLALKTGATQWWIGSHEQGETTDVDDGATVLGVAISRQHPKPGLVVLHPGRRRVELRVGPLRYELATSPEAIQQASMDAASARIAWITAKSSTVVVRGLDDEQPLLQISCDGGTDDADA